MDSNSRNGATLEKITLAPGLSDIDVGNDDTEPAAGFLSGRQLLQRCDARLRLKSPNVVGHSEHTAWYNATHYRAQRTVWTFRVDYIVRRVYNRRGCGLCLEGRRHALKLRRSA